MVKNNPSNFTLTVAIIGLSLTLIGVVLSDWWGAVAAVSSSLTTGVLAIHFIEKRKETHGVR